MPDDQRRRRSKPTHATRVAPGYGWRHGKTPPAPRGLGDEAKRAWAVWMSSWTAALWEAAHLTMVEVAVRLYDAVVTSEGPSAGLSTALRHYLDGLGLTPKGAQMLRWQRPVEGEVKAPVKEPTSDRYRSLRVVVE